MAAASYVAKSLALVNLGKYHVRHNLRMESRMRQNLRDLFTAVAAGHLSPEQALATFNESGVETLGHTRVDHDRARRCGFPEVILAESKTPDQVVEISAAILKRSPFVLVTRLSDEARKRLQGVWPAGDYDLLARTALLGEPAAEIDSAPVLVVCAGTSDLPVAREALVTARAMGCRTELLADVGVAGLHRLLAQEERLRTAGVIVVVAGMEGALPSVVGGLVRCPVIAVPTSVGYGASFGGLAALLGMLNSCASGVGVVNIDNGFGAGFLAGRIVLNERRS